jgi:hypothetical protein
VNFKNEAKRLFTSSTLEEKRVKVARPDPREITHFKDIEILIAHSFFKSSVESSRSKNASEPTPRNDAPKLFGRTLKDDQLLKKLIQHRDEIPLSNRIIRKKDQ